MRHAPLAPELLDEADRSIINALQIGFPIAHRPFAEAGKQLGIDEEALIARLKRLRDLGAITRFGPFFDAEAMGGSFCLCAMEVPAARFEQVMTLVNAHPEVAHNYERDHRFNMWFVLACDSPHGIQRVAKEIEQETRLHILQFPKLREFFIGFRIEM